MVTPGGEVRQVADGIVFGNGMAVTEDGSTLIVAESQGCGLSAFDIELRRRVVEPARMGGPR